MALLVQAVVDISLPFLLVHASPMLPACRPCASAAAGDPAGAAPAARVHAAAPTAGGGAEAAQRQAGAGPHAAGAGAGSGGTKEAGVTVGRKI